MVKGLFSKVRDFGHKAWVAVDLWIYRRLGHDTYMRAYRLRVWWALLAAGLMLSRVHYGVWLSGSGPAIESGLPGIVNVPAEALIYALVRIPAAVLISHLVKRTLFRDFETSQHPILSGLVYGFTILGVVLA